mgnify:CR=1 FL=1
MVGLESMSWFRKYGLAGLEHLAGLDAKEIIGLSLDNDPRLQDFT